MTDLNWDTFGWPQEAPPVRRTLRRTVEIQARDALNGMKVRRGRINKEPAWKRALDKRRRTS